MMAVFFERGKEMEILTILIKQIALMFVLIMIGYVLCRKKLITLQGSGEMGKILLNVVIPCVIINSFWCERTAEKTATLLQGSVIAVVVMAVAVIISTLVYGLRDGVSCFSSAFSNAGFIGIPLVQAVLGSSAVFYLSLMIVLVNFLQWTYGLYVLTGDKGKMKMSVVAKNPVVISVVAGVVIYLMNLPRFAFTDTLISSITAVNTPVAMLVTGVYLAQSPLSDIISDRRTWMVSILRLLVIPAVSLLVMKLFPFGTQEMKVAIMIAAACPVGSNVSIFAQQVGASFRDATNQVCLSTILCLPTIPLLTLLTTVVL